MLLGNNPYLNMMARYAFTGLTLLRELELERNGLTQLDVSILESLPTSYTASGGQPLVLQLQLLPKCMANEEPLQVPNG